MTSRYAIVKHLRASQGPSILYGQSDDIILAYACGPLATFVSQEGRTELDHHGRAIPMIPHDDDLYVDQCEPSGNGLWLHLDTDLMGRTPGEACAVSICQAYYEQMDRANRRRAAHRARRVEITHRRQSERDWLNNHPPFVQEVVEHTPALQYAVMRLCKRVATGSLLREDVSSEDVFDMVDEFYAMPALATLDDALELGDDMDDDEAVEVLLSTAPSATTGKRKRSDDPTTPAPALGSITRGTVVLHSEPVVITRSLRAILTRNPEVKSDRPPAHRDVPAGPPVLRPIAGNSRTRAQTKSVHFASAIAVERNGSIWPSTDHHTTDATARDPSQFAEAVRELEPELFHFILFLIDMNLGGEESRSQEEEDEDEDARPAKRTRAGTPSARRNGESSNSHHDDDDDDE